VNGLNLTLMRRRRLFAIALAVALLPAIGTAVASAETQVSADQQHMGLLGPGDSVTIQIYGQPESTNVYVGDDGMLSVPLAGPVPVGGVSPVEAAARVAKALKDGGYFVDPHVTIIVTQSHSQLVSVVGEVEKPGRYPVTPRTTIVDLVALAGGTKDSASDVGYVLRGDASGHVNRYPINLNGLTDVGDSLPTATLQGGDSLVVPRAALCYVYGEVTTPGAYRLGPGLTVLQAISKAGGVTARGSERRIQVKRAAKDGHYEISRAKPGDLVQPDDIIQVKESIF
jgi:polysaccharide biosynthesis/export protein